MRTARTGKHHAVARAGQPPPHRKADVPCTEDSDLHVYLLRLISIASTRTRRCVERPHRSGRVDGRRYGELAQDITDHHSPPTPPKPSTAQGFAPAFWATLGDRWVVTSLRFITESAAAP